MHGSLSLAIRPAFAQILRLWQPVTHLSEFGHRFV
jgi:hypothetical protein